MKIIIIHYRYYQASGPERYMFNFMKLFKQYGHEVIPFSINYGLNENNEYQEYFVDPVMKDSEFHINEISNISVKDKVKIIKNLFYNKEAYQNLDKLIKRIKPDLVYVLQYYGKLSPSIFDACKKNNVPVVLRLSDYNLLCAKNILFRNNEICTKCLKNNVFEVFNKCTQESYIKSLIAYLGRKYFYLKNFQNVIDTIITPSKFTKDIFKNHKRFLGRKIVHIPTFIWEEEINEIHENPSLDDSLCYFGRIAEDKGILTVLKALRILKDQNIYPKLLVIGDDKNDYGEELKEYCKNWELENVQFLGFLKKEQLFSKIRNTKFSIVPSVWYDNMPNSLIESQAMGLPVIASEIGSLKELITTNNNGFLFKTNDEKHLAEIIKKGLKLENKKIHELRLNSINWVKDYCSEHKHYEELLKVFSESINKNIIK